MFFPFVSPLVSSIFVKNNHFQILLILQRPCTSRHLINNPRCSSLILLRPFSPHRRDQTRYKISNCLDLFKPSYHRARSSRPAHTAQTIHRFPSLLFIYSRRVVQRAHVSSLPPFLPSFAGAQNGTSCFAVRSSFSLSPFSLAFLLSFYFSVETTKESKIRTGGGGGGGEGGGMLSEQGPLAMVSGGSNRSGCNRKSCWQGQKHKVARSSATRDMQIRRN